MNHLIIRNEIINHELLISDVIDNFTQLKNSAHTQRSYKNDVVSFFKGLDVDFLVDFGLTPYHQVVDNIHSFLKENTKKDEKTQRVLNAKTVNRKAYALSSFFNYLMDTYNYPKNPVRSFTPLKTEKRSTTTSLTRAEIIDFLEFARAEHRLCQSRTQAQ